MGAQWLSHVASGLVGAALVALAGRLRWLRSSSSADARVEPPAKPVSPGREMSDPHGTTSAPPNRNTEARVIQNVEAVLALQTRVAQRVSRHQHLIENVTQSLGRPRTIYVTMGVALGWGCINSFLSRGGHAPDPPPFYWLQGVVGLCALLMTTMVLTTQNGQGRHAEQRSHLDLQVNLLAEQKIAKLIALIEELRRDLPSVKNRKDSLADAMAEAVDPTAVISALEDSFEQGSRPRNDGDNPPADDLPGPPREPPATE